MSRSSSPFLRLPVALTIVIGFAKLAHAQQASPRIVPADAAVAAIATRHATWCHERYAEAELRAKALLRAIETLVAKPGAPELAAARTAWTAARAVYCETEVLRFQDGPIEPIEPFVNAWPIDEVFLDYVVGAPDAGIVQDAQRFPNLTQSVLRLANERGGEANVSTGWHAIEFLLWGQDLDAEGPGQRPATDFAPEHHRCARRRGECLLAITRMLVGDLGKLRAAWAPDADNYRRRFLQEPARVLPRLLAGATVLTAFELAGERLTVALETRDQEQEHSCFSDTTCQDLVANQLGIVAVLGAGAGPSTGLAALLAAHEPALATLLGERLQTSLTALRAIPAPFDRAIRGAAGTDGPRSLAAAIEALEAQTEVLLLVGKAFGIDLPLKPGG
jgi:putative iron-regulated protein